MYLDWCVNLAHLRVLVCVRVNVLVHMSSIFGIFINARPGARLSLSLSVCLSLSARVCICARVRVYVCACVHVCVCVCVCV